MMKREIKEQLEEEQLLLFRQLWAALVSEGEQLANDVATARNLACSTMEYDGPPFGIMVERILPERMDILKKNEALLKEELSRKKFFLLKAFLPILRRKNAIGAEGKLILDYWDKELKKKEPNLVDRFAEVSQYRYAKVPGS
jgi:hypothetical protein